MSNFTYQNKLAWQNGVNEKTIAQMKTEYQKVVVKSLLTSFALDVFIQDQHGGDVDTIHSVRQIGKDSKMHYKSKVNEAEYENRAAYDSHKYHSDEGYISGNQKIANDKKSGKLKDAYTGEKIARNGKTDQDHIVAAKEIDDDRGVNLWAGGSQEKKIKLANRADNLVATNPRTNRTKKASSIPDFLSKRGNEYTEDQKERMRAADYDARHSQEKIVKEYYLSERFRTDLSKAVAKNAAKATLVQAAGLVLAEIWFEVKPELDRLPKPFSAEKLLQALSCGVQKGYESAKRRYKEILHKLLDSAVASALSTITTTLCNCFFTTSANAVKLIRHSYQYVVEAFDILVLNTKKVLAGVRVKEAAKVLSTGASVVAGVLLQQGIQSTAIGQIPVLSTVVPQFCGAFVSGVLSCTFLYILDQDPVVGQMVDAMNELYALKGEALYFKEKNNQLKLWKEKLDVLDLKTFKSDCASYRQLAQRIDAAPNEKAKGRLMEQSLKKQGSSLPWGKKSFEKSMKEKDPFHIK